MQKLKIFFTAILALTGWFALILQFYIMYKESILQGTSTMNMVINYFSYFTILTNILVAYSLTVLSIKPASKQGKFFSKPSAAAAVAVYITIVGLIYNTLLRQLWNPEGWQLVADELLHLVIPVLYILYWFLFVPRIFLPWKALIWWLVYPFIYLIYILLYGAYSEKYPYPFIDAGVLGYTKTLANAGMLFVLFVLMSLVFITLDRMIGKISR